MMRRTNIKIGVLLLATVTSCSSRDDAAQQAPASGFINEDSLLAIAEVTASATELPWKEGFHRVGDAEFWDQKLLVANGAPARVLVFSLQGQLLDSMGAEGRGPGEFARLWSVEAFGDSLLATDARQHRISVFDSRLRYVRSIQIDVPTYGSLGRCRVVGRSARCVLSVAPDPRSVPDNGTGWDSVFVGEVSLDGPGPAEFTRVTTSLPRMMFTRHVQAASTRVEYDEASGDVFVDPGDPVRVAVTHDDILLEWREGSWTAIANGRARNLERVPLIAGDLARGKQHQIWSVAWDDEGGAWVATYTVARGLRRWVWFDASGRALARVMLPENERGLRAHDSAIVLRQTDSLDSESVVLRRTSSKVTSK